MAGFDVFTQSLEVRRRIGYMPETVPLYPEMTVRSYLEYLAHLRTLTAGDQGMAYAMDVCGIAHDADTSIGKLSKGYRQRVGLAQALLHNPEVLVLDEPTIGLDPKQVVEVRRLIRDLGGEWTIILSTHILPEVSEICGRVLIINQGRIVAEDTPKCLTARLQGAERIRLQVQGADEELRQRLAAIEGVLPVEPLNGIGYEVQSALGVDVRPQLAAAVVNGGWGLLEMRPGGMSLEQIFLKLTTDETGTALSQNQIVAGVLGIVILLVLSLLEPLAQAFGPPISEFLLNLSLGRRFPDFAKGVIDSKDVVYYLSVTVAGLFLTTRSLEARRWT